MFSLHWKCTQAKIGGHGKILKIVVEMCIAIATQLSNALTYREIEFSKGGGIFTNPQRSYGKERSRSDKLGWAKLGGIVTFLLPPTLLLLHNTLIG